MKRAILDIVQCVGLLLIGGGIWAQWGGALAALVTGVLLVLVPMVELHLIRKGG